jgi:MFS-type transporter involved in bile tolerance (Atg22 family)
LGEIVILAVIVGIMFGLRVNESEERNNWGLSVLIAFATGVWLLLAIPWFALEKRRPGQDPGMNIVVAGFWQLYRAVTQIWQLKQSFFYLIGEFDNSRMDSKIIHLGLLIFQATSSSETRSTQR